MQLRLSQINLIEMQNGSHDHCWTVAGFSVATVELEQEQPVENIFDAKCIEKNSNKSWDQTNLALQAQVPFQLGIGTHW